METDCVTKPYTKIPNELLDRCDISIQARYLLCVLLRHNAGTGKCFPTQGKLGEELGRSTKQIRVILDELIKAKIITKRRRGYNRSNDYFISNKYIIKNLPATTAKNYTNETKTYPVKSYKTTNHPNADDLLNSKKEIVKDNMYFEKLNGLESTMQILFKKKHPLRIDKENVSVKDSNNLGSNTIKDTSNEVLDYKTINVDSTSNTEESGEKLIDEKCSETPLHMIFNTDENQKQKSRTNLTNIQNNSSEFVDIYSYKVDGGSEH